MNWFLIFCLVGFHKSVKGSIDDYKSCQRKFNCTKNLTPHDCPPGEFLDTRFSNNCCHGCRAGIGHGESGCSPTVLNKKCAPGLKCDEDFYCTLERTSCLHTMHFGDEVRWKPTCEIDGSYSAKQCRGDKLTGRCFCFTDTGERVFGWEWWREAADKMSCACSRQRQKAEALGRLTVSLHCLQNGNFEELQCDMGICWCADEIDGHVMKGTFAVPESLWTYLPCYNSSFHGDQYLRKCESAAFAQKMMQKKLINRGAINTIPNQIQCNYDGQYGDIVIINPLAFCQTTEGVKLSYSSPSKMLHMMDCNCARDERIFKKLGIEFNLRCKESGNYESLQDQNGKMFCVDRDGYAVSPLLSPESGLDCDQFFYYAQEDLFIENV